MYFQHFSNTLSDIQDKYKRQALHLFCYSTIWNFPLKNPHCYLNILASLHVIAITMILKWQHHAPVSLRWPQLSSDVTRLQTHWDLLDIKWLLWHHTLSLASLWHITSVWCHVLTAAVAESYSDATRRDARVTTLCFFPLLGQWQGGGG